MARPRKTTNVTKKHLTKKEKITRQEQENKIKLDREELYDAPEWIKEDLLAYNEFIRVVNQAAMIDLWDNLDLSVIAIYCKAYSNYIRVTKHIAENGYTGIGKDGMEKISPYVTAQNKFIEQILKCSSKLGLATTDRLKLIVPEPEKKENKFAKFIK